MSEQSEPSSSSAPAAGPSISSAGPRRFVQPPARHTSTILDPRKEEYLPNRKDAKGEDKVNDLGELKYGREYVCEAVRNPGSTSQRLFLSARSCADVLGYSDEESMVRDNSSLFLVSKSTPSGNEPDDDKLVSALSMFRQFGHRLVKRGRPVFDDYFESLAAEQGIEDNTLWAAAGGSVPDDKALAILRKADIDDLSLEESTGMSAIDLMVDFFFDRPKPQSKKAPRVEATRSLLEELAQLFGRILTSNGQPDVQHSIRNEMRPCLDGEPSRSGYKESQTHRILRAALAHGSLIAGNSAREDDALENLGSTSALVAEWMVPAVVERSKSDGRNRSVSEVVSTFVVVSGSDSDYECAQCKDIVHARWGEFGYQVLQWLCTVVESVLELEDSETTRVQLVHFDSLQDFRSSRHPLSFLFSREGGALCSASRSSLVLSGLLRDLAQDSKDLSSLIEVISWVCAAFRPSIMPGENPDAASSQMLLSCTRQWQLVGDSERRRSWLFLEPKPLKLMKTLGTPHNCWTELFLSVTVVETTLQRRWGRGLKISFDLMCRLAAIQNIWKTSEGMVLFGFFTALIPTQIETWGPGIQWHFECHEAGKGMLLPKDLSMVPGVDLEMAENDSHIGLAGVSARLRDRECFIGWHPSANIMLGTKRLVDGTPSWDWTHSLQPVPQKLERSGYETAGQMGVEAGPITLTAVAAQQQAYVPYKVRFEPSSDYQTTLLDQEGKTCLLIDNGAKQAWLVPLLSVLLHMCHCYGQIQWARGRLTRIPFAAESPLGDHAVREAIKDFGPVNIFELEEDGQIFFAQLFHSLLFRLKMVKLPVPETSRIFAIEVMDIITKKDTSPKEIPCKGRWSHLVPFASLVDVVAVAEGIGHAIRPLSEQRCACTVSCHELPQHRGYLAAHVSALESLTGSGHSVFKLSDAVGRGKSQLTPETCWIPQHDPWMWSGHARPTCQGVWMHKGLTDMIVQRTTSNRRASLFSQPSLSPALTNIPQDGVIVFGAYQKDAESRSRRDWLPKLIRRFQADT